MLKNIRARRSQNMIRAILVEVVCDSKIAEHLLHLKCCSRLAAQTTDRKKPPTIHAKVLTLLRGKEVGT
jgi:hypothetical protein